jgi:exodeoxyribonuclease VII small subunit
MDEPGSHPQPSFEAALDRLEEIVRTLEAGEMPLEKALEVFEEGVRLSRLCHGKLRQAERRIEILLQGEDGEIKPGPFGTDAIPERG